MTDSAQQRRPWSFSLRTLLLLVAGAGVTLGWLAMQTKLILERQAALAALPDGAFYLRFCDFGPGHQQPQLSPAARLRRLLGDEPVEFFWIRTADFDGTVNRLRPLFPEADYSTTDE